MFEELAVQVAEQDFSVESGRASHTCSTRRRGPRLRRSASGTAASSEAAGASVPAAFLFNGSLSPYEKLGFTGDRMIGKHRWMVTRVVEPATVRQRAWR